TTKNYKLLTNNCPMTSLTRAKKMTRVFALGLGAALFLLIVGKVGLTILNSLTIEKRIIQRQNMPTMTFGQIAQPKLPSANVTTETTTIQLDLVSGNLPQASATASVFRAADPSLSLSAQDRARAKANNLGFTTGSTQPTPSTFEWQDDIR